MKLYEELSSISSWLVLWHIKPLLGYFCWTPPPKKGLKITILNTNNLNMISRFKFELICLTVYQLHMGYLMPNFDSFVNVLLQS